MKWIKASERLPGKRGQENSVIIKGGGFGKDQFGRSYPSPFVTKGFVNFYKEAPKFYFLIGNQSFLTNENIEWLDETEDSQFSSPEKIKSAEEMAVLFHDTYERLAPEFGYETRKDTKQFNPETPNGKLMIAVCSEIRAQFSSQGLLGALRLAEMEIEAMYKRVDINNSNVLDIIKRTISKYEGD